MHYAVVFIADKSFLVQTSTKHSAVPMAGSLCVTAVSPDPQWSDPAANQE